MNRKKIFRILIAATVVMVAFAYGGKRAGWFGKGAEYEVTTESAAKRTIVEIITANGKLKPETEVKISSDVSGEIVELHVKEGYEVKKGDLLLKIKPDTYISSLERMEASLNSAKANLANSRARLSQSEAQLDQTELSYKRNKKLFDQGAISQAEFDNAQSSFNIGKAEVEAAKQIVVAAEFQVKSAEASLKEANENLIKTSIYAPMPGTVSKLNVELGERVVGTMQMAGTELLRIADLSIMEVKVEVSENDIINVKYNDSATIEIDAYPDYKFTGIVTSVANSSTSSGVTSVISTDQVTSFEVKIRILSESYKMLIPPGNPKYFPFRPGMSATVDIRTKVEKNILSVPIQSVTTRIDSTEGNTGNKNVSLRRDTVQKSSGDYREYVFRYENGIVHLQPVKTGIQDNTYIQINEGLKEGDEVVTAPYSVISKKLKDKGKVKKIKPQELFTKD